MDKSKLLTQLEKECLSCTRCEIGGCQISTDAGCFLSNVFSNMCMKARIMVVGQNPGAREIEQRRPFVGPSGANFDRAIKEVLGLDRSHFYITNTVHCFTQSNRKPFNKEIEMCRYFLDREVKVVDPVVIITLGGPALQQVTGVRGIQKHHAQPLVSARYGKPVLPLYHTSPLNMNHADRKEAFYKGLEKLQEYLGG